MRTLCGFGESKPPGSSSVADFLGATGEGLAISPVRAVWLSTVTREGLDISPVRGEESAKDSSKFCGRSIMDPPVKGEGVVSAPSVKDGVTMSYNERGASKTC